MTAVPGTQWAPIVPQLLELLERAVGQEHAALRHVAMVHEAGLELPRDGTDTGFRTANIP